MDKRKKTVSYYLDNDVINKIEEQAIRGNRSTSSWLNLFLRDKLGLTKGE